MEKTEMTTVSLTEALLACDAKSILEKETIEFEVERLSKKLGRPFVLTLQAIAPERYTEIQMEAINIDSEGSVEQGNIFNMQVLQICEGVKTPSLNDKALMKHFGVETPKDLVSKLFLSGEIAKIAEEVAKASGYDKKKEKKQVKAVKN